MSWSGLPYVPVENEDHGLVEPIRWWYNPEWQQFENETDENEIDRGHFDA